MPNPGLNEVLIKQNRLQMIMMMMMIIIIIIIIITTNRYPEYKVNQYNIIMDVLGGCSKEVEKNIKELVGDKCESIMRQMQKAILSSSLNIARMFKLSD